MTKKQNKNIVPNGVGLFVWEIVKIFTFAAIIIIPIRMFLFQPFLVQGASMEPNFSSGEYLIINEIGYKRVKIGTGDDAFTIKNPHKILHRGDNVVFRFPKNERKFFIKRVIGLPGEHIIIRDGSVYISDDGSTDERYLLDEKYLPNNTYVSSTESIDMKISGNEYFVMGDNRDGSYDSRAWGPLNKDFVMGKVALRVWPISRATVFN